jgi:hypothetical protein
MREIRISFYKEILLKINLVKLIYSKSKILYYLTNFKNVLNKTDFLDEQILNFKRMQNQDNKVL